MSAQYFAKLDDNNVVIHIAVVQREFFEANPQRYTGRWVETFFDTAGKQYAGLGMVYDETREDFKPFASWIWSNNQWQAPTPMPSTGGPYRWSEEELEWVAI